MSASDREPRTIEESRAAAARRLNRLQENQRPRDLRQPRADGTQQRERLTLDDIMAQGREPVPAPQVMQKRAVLVPEVDAPVPPQAVRPPLPRIETPTRRALPSPPRVSRDAARPEVPYVARRGISGADVVRAEMLDEYYRDYPGQAIVERVQLNPLLLLPLCALCVVVIWMFLSPVQTIVGTQAGSSGAVVQSPEAPAVLLEAPPGENTVLGASSLTSAQIDAILQSYGSPAAGTGQAWIDAGQRYGIDAAYAVAFFIHESTAGTAEGWAGWKPDGSSTHNVGNIICAGYPTCFNRFRDYADWETGIADWYKLIAVEYVEGRGAHTVEQIIPIYAPSFENNVPMYVQTVNNLVYTWRQRPPG